MSILFCYIGDKAYTGDTGSTSVIYDAGGKCKVSIYQPATLSTLTPHNHLTTSCEVFMIQDTSLFCILHKKDTHLESIMYNNTTIGNVL